MEKWQQNSEELYCRTRHKHLVHYEPFSQKKGSSFSRRGQEGNHPKLRRLQQTKSTKSSGNSLHTSQLIQWSVNIINSGFSQGVPSQSSVLQSLLWVSTLFVFILLLLSFVNRPHRWAFSRTVSEESGSLDHLDWSCWSLPFLEECDRKIKVSSLKCYTYI